ncbi:MAG: single-stranded DNA-binding protein [Fusobacterium sp.]|nr:single-stranded DNA-binding protein [Fusobacterium sp.]
MALKNSVRLVGNVGNDITLEKTTNDNKYVQISLAINNKIKNSNGELEEKTSWFRCVAWNKTAELVNEFVNKGDEIIIDGFLNSNTYEKEGEKRTAVEVVVNEFYLTKKNK